VDNLFSRDGGKPDDFWNSLMARARPTMGRGCGLMMCAWCGSKGGFANRLIINLVGLDAAIYECEWCAMKISVDLMKQGVEWND